MERPAGPAAGRAVRSRKIEAGQRSTAELACARMYLMGQNMAAGIPVSALPERDSMITRRQFLRTSGTAAIAAGSGLMAGCSQSPGKAGVVNVLTWGDPNKAKLMGEAFKEETGITLKMVPGLDDADFWNKIRYGGIGTYDTVVTNIGYLPLYQKAGYVEVLHLNDFSSAGELYPQYRTDMRFPYLLSPDKAYCFPDQWGLYGMTFSKISSFKVTAPYSWGALWKAPKGTVMLDGAPTVNMAVAARMAGIPWDRVFSINAHELDIVVQRLRQLKPFQIPSSTDGKINDFRTKVSDVGLVYSLGFGEQIGKNIAESVVPVEGALGALDGQILLKNAPNRANALKWINFLGGKRAQLIFWDLYQGPTVNKAATDAIIAKGGAQAASIIAQGGNKPELCATMTELRQADNPSAWNLAWDRVLAD